MTSARLRASRDDLAAVGIDDTGMSLPAGTRAALDVSFDGRRVWSFLPEKHGQPGDESVRVPWPKALRRFLDGATRVALYEHLTGRVLVDREYQFRSAAGRVRVADAEGWPLVVDHVGHLVRPFAASGSETLESLLDGLNDILRVLHDDCDLPGFVAFGALLGAVREGKLLGHDSDIDVSYLSRHDHPLDAARESFRIERAMRRHGFDARRMSADDFKVRFPVADGSIQAIDIFGGFQCEDWMYIMPRLRVRLRREDILPLGTVELEGRSFPAPADPAKFLAAAYGDSWEVPDPAWQPAVDRPARRRFEGWMRGLRNHRDYWEGFHARTKKAGQGAGPSAFARWVADQEPAPVRLVDIGSGKGNDALWFARAGHQVTGLDYCHTALGQARKTVQESDLPIAFTSFNLYELRHVLPRGASLARADEPVVLYGRLILDALDSHGREYFWRFVDMAMRSGGRLYLDFSTAMEGVDVDSLGRPLLRPLDADQVVSEIHALGGTVRQRVDGHREHAAFADREFSTCWLATGL